MRLHQSFLLVYHLELALHQQSPSLGDEDLVPGPEGVLHHLDPVLHLLLAGPAVEDGGDRRVELGDVVEVDILGLGEVEVGEGECDEEAEGEDQEGQVQADGGGDGGEEGEDKEGEDGGEGSEDSFAGGSSVVGEDLGGDEVGEALGADLYEEGEDRNNQERDPFVDEADLEEDHKGKDGLEGDGETCCSQVDCTSSEKETYQKASPMETYPKFLMYFAAITAATRRTKQMPTAAQKPNSEECW